MLKGLTVGLRVTEVFAQSFYCPERSRTISTPKSDKTIYECGLKFCQTLQIQGFPAYVVA